MRYCDGVSRRGFLRIGSLGLGGLTLADLLRLNAAAGTTGKPAPPTRAIINVHLGGGPPHLDTFDLKPHAPREVRGDFRSIATKVPGLDLCEHFPRLALLADKLAIIRSLVGSVGDHDSYQTASGWGVRDLKSAGGRPSLGAVASRLIGSRDGKSPPFIDFSSKGNPGYLGAAYGAYSPNTQGAELSNLRRQSYLPDSRLNERVELRRNLDRHVTATASMESVDTFTERAAEVLSSGRVLKALDLTREDPRLVSRYRGEVTSDYRSRMMSQHNERLLYARRLIEAGVRCVSLSWGSWDTHVDNFRILKPQLPMFDVGMSVLLEDLEARGMLHDVLVVAWGEFGRTPRINPSNGGRDHWPQVACAMLFGGGLKGGQVIGSTNRLGEHAADRPVHYQELMATLYHQMGIDVARTQFPDLNGRPQYLLEHRTPVRELISV